MEREDEVLISLSILHVVFGNAQETTAAVAIKTLLTEV